MRASVAIGHLTLLLAALLMASSAQAAGSFCVSSDVLTFGNRAVGSSTTMSATVSNCGDAAFDITGVSVDPATGPAFHPSTTCLAGLSLLPGDECRVDVVFAPFAAGQTSGGLWLSNTSGTPSRLVAFYGRGTDQRAGTATPAFAPASLDFGAQAVGTHSPPLAVMLENAGPATLTPSAIILNGPAAYDFSGFEDSCGVGVTIPAGKSCQLSIYFGPQQTGQRLADLVIDAPELASLAILQISGTGAPAAQPAPYEGLWWNSPAGSESGWGIVLTQQGDTIFAAWFTYDLAGKPRWLVMSADRIASNTYAGTLYQTTGPPFDAAPFPPIGSAGGAAGTVVGSGTFTFDDANDATFAYTVDGVSQTKSITRESFGPVPGCTFGGGSDPALATSYQDLWWNAPAGSESGWGIEIVHEGDTIVAIWFTYDRDRSPMWLIATLARTGATTYSGNLFRMTGGPAFDAVPFPPLGSPGSASGSIVGTATLDFSDGNAAAFSYSVDGVAQTKSITREVLVSPGTVCR